MNDSTGWMPRLLQITPHRRLWAVVLALLLVVVSVSALVPGDRAPTLGMGDKLNHLAAFIALGLAATLAQASRRPGWTAFGLLVYGGLIEWLQTRIPGRQGDLVDLLVDLAGIVLGLGLAALLRRPRSAARP